MVKMQATMTEQFSELYAATYCQRTFAKKKTNKTNVEGNTVVHPERIVEKTSKLKLTERQEEDIEWTTPCWSFRNNIVLQAW